MLNPSDQKNHYNTLSTDGNAIVSERDPESGSLISTSVVMTPLFKMASAEFIGTFFLTFYVSATKITTAVDAAPYAIGVGLIALIYATAQVSGGQLNPAVTIGLLFRNKLTFNEAYYCWMGQFAGAIFAGMLCAGMYSAKWDEIGYPSVMNDDRQIPAFFGELIQTFALVSAVLNTATTDLQKDNSYYGISIGLVVLSGALVIGNITGACFNPALSVLTLFHGDIGDVWVFLLGPALGGLLAGAVFFITNPDEWDSGVYLQKVIASVNPHYVHNPNHSTIRTLAQLSQEFIGTFMLTWIVALTSNTSMLVSGYIAVGAILSSIVYSGGAISGGQYNPCVTLGVYLRSKYVRTDNSFSGVQAGLYIVTQIFASFVGGLAAAYVNGGFDLIAGPAINLLDHSDLGAMLAEFLFSFLLVLTVLTTATTKKFAGNSYFGLAIGLVVIAGGITIGDFSGGCFNPAIAISLPLLKGSGVYNIGYYVVGELLGGAAAAGVFTYWHMGSEEV